MISDEKAHEKLDETLKVTRFLLTNVMDVKEESLNEIDECFSK